MPALPITFTAAPERARLPQPARPEREVLDRMAAAVQGALDWPRVVEQARPWVQAVRHKPAPFWALESLLREYPISSAEGLALMRLAEALLRVPDTETAIALTADQLGQADFSEHHGGHHPLLAGLSAQAIALSKKFLPRDADTHAVGLIQRVGAQTVVAATVRAIQLLGRQFVLGRSIEEAAREADEQRRDQGAAGVPAALCFSYDMLGEGARTDDDAHRYLAAYQHAIETLAQRAMARGPEGSDGISIKLSALFSRDEVAQRARASGGDDHQQDVARALPAQPVGVHHGRQRRAARGLARLQHRRAAASEDVDQAAGVGVDLGRLRVAERAGLADQRLQLQERRAELGEQEAVERLIDGVDAG